MIDFFRDSIWQFIGFIITAIIAIAIYLKERKNKTLSYKIHRNSPLLAPSDDIKHDVEIYYRGNLVSNIHICTVQIKNTGNIPILASDFEKPIKIEFGEDQVQVMSANVSNFEPNSLLIETILSKKDIEIKSLLLNPGDTFEITALINGKAPKIFITGRIAGVSDILPIKSKAKFHRYAYIAGSLLYTLIMMYFVSLTSPFEGVRWLFAFAAILGLWFCMINFFRLVFENRPNIENS